jgi:hypothetical protein
MAGSSLFFWRWNGLMQHTFAREGMPMHVIGTLPGMAITQRPPKPGKLELFAAKLQKAIERGYFEEGGVWSSIGMFDTPKGLDFHVVCNGTLSGLNVCIWAPSFFLPSDSAPLRVMSFTLFMLDADIGKMFLILQCISPFDLMLELIFTIFERRFKLLILISCLLFWGVLAVRFYYLANEFPHGNPRVELNAIHYDSI